MARRAAAVAATSSGARALAVLGDSVTTDHISPAGSIAPWSPAGQWLQAHGVGPLEFNSYGARRGHHEVMMRGTFGEHPAAQPAGRRRRRGRTRSTCPSGEETFIYDAAMRYAPRACRSWSSPGASTARARRATGRPRAPTLLGVRAVIAESFERIHRSNLVGMGVLPLQFKPGDSAASLGLTGRETYSILGLAGGPDAAPDA